jgi:hypothetical protein
VVQVPFLEDKFWISTSANALETPEDEDIPYDRPLHFPPVKVLIS